MRFTEKSIDREQRHVIIAVTIGNILEWFEIYSYIYLVTILAKVFFGFHSLISNITGAFIVFGIGSISRLIGAYIFGHIGDLLGRRNTFILSITMMTVPTFVVGFLPGYNVWGVFAPAALIIFRFLQSIPAAGETPGTVCFLYENVDRYNKRFITSFAAFGNQLGAIVALLEVLLVDQVVSEEFMLNWGWRISFWSGGVIGICGILLRQKLHETPLFNKLKKAHHINKHAFRSVIRKCKKAVGLGIAYCAVDAVTFYLIAAYIPTYLERSLSLGPRNTDIATLGVLAVSTFLLPIFGIIGDKVCNKLLLVASALMILISMPILSFYMDNSNFYMTSIIALILIFPMSCITALLTYLVSGLFKTSLRFTGIGLAFNIVDGLLGGFTPVVALMLLKYTNSQASFCRFIFLCTLISFFAYLFIDKENGVCTD